MEDTNYVLETTLTGIQIESIIKLINNERSRNIENGNEAYNTHWENIIMALGYAVIK